LAGLPNSTKFQLALDAMGTYSKLPYTGRGGIPMFKKVNTPLGISTKPQPCFFLLFDSSAMVWAIERLPARGQTNPTPMRILQVLSYADFCHLLKS
jgi:hypothetical protein